MQHKPQDAARVQQELKTFRYLAAYANNAIDIFGSDSKPATDATNAYLSAWRDLSPEARATLQAEEREAAA